MQSAERRTQNAGFQTTCLTREMIPQLGPSLGKGELKLMRPDSSDSSVGAVLPPYSYTVGIFLLHGIICITTSQRPLLAQQRESPY